MMTEEIVKPLPYDDDYHVTIESDKEVTKRSDSDLHRALLFAIIGHASSTVDGPTYYLVAALVAELASYRPTGWVCRNDSINAAVSRMAVAAQEVVDLCDVGRQRED